MVVYRLVIFHYIIVDVLPFKNISQFYRFTIFLQKRLLLKNIKKNHTSSKLLNRFLYICVPKHYFALFHMTKEEF